MSGLLLRIVLSVCTCRFHNTVTLPPSLVSTHSGTCSYHCFCPTVLLFPCICWSVAVHTLYHVFFCTVLVPVLGMLILCGLYHHHHHHCAIDIWLDMFTNNTTAVCISSRKWTQTEVSIPLLPQQLFCATLREVLQESACWLDRRWWRHNEANKIRKWKPPGGQISTVML